MFGMFLVQPSSLFSGFGAAPGGQTQSAFSFPTFQTAQQGKADMLG